MARPLRVLVLDQGDGVWGAQRYLLRLAPRLRGWGVELVLAGPPGLELHQVWRDHGLDAVALQLPIGRSIRSRGRVDVSRLAREAAAVPAMARRIARLAACEKVDVLWANSHWIHLDTALAGRIAGVPTVLHLHEESLPGIGTRLRTLAVRLSTAAVAVSAAVAAGLPEGARQRVSVISNGVDTEYYRPARCGAEVAEARALREELGVSDGEIMVLAASRLDPSKRIEDVIAAAASNPGVRLVIAGDTSTYPDYALRVREQAAGSGVRLAGRRDDMVALFRAADVVLHAGVVEGMPLGLLEAQACGVPVVAYGVAGVPEVVEDGVTGLLAPIGDAGLLARHLSTLVNDAALRARLGVQAHDRAQRRHRIEQQARRNADMLMRIVGRVARETVGA